MEPLTEVVGVAAALRSDNIDTDVIIPSREITSPSREGFGARLFAPWRFSAPGGPENPEFVLNREPWRHARILIAGRNFGCGSSREMAVWALVQFGIRCVIAPSFGAIFRDNCIRNALLPVTLPEPAVEDLATRAEAVPLLLHVDLRRCEVRGPEGLVYGFTIDDGEREMLLTGMDAIDRTLQRLPAIEAFEATDRQRRPWIWTPG